MEKNKEPLVLSIDCGTQSIRGLVFDQKGKLLAKVKREFEPYISTGPGFAEQDPYVYWNHGVECVKLLHKESPEVMNRVAAICVTTIRNTGVFLGEQGNIVKPSMTWLDQREANNLKKMSIHFRAAFKVIGMDRAIEATRKQSKTNWIRKHEPKTWEDTRYYLQVSGFFHYKLTGKILDSTANQIGHIPFNYRTQDWCKSKWAYQYEMFDIEKEKLSPIVKPSSVIGILSKEAMEQLGFEQEIKVIAGASDKGSETLGVGCLDATKASISFGTTATIQTTTDAYLEPIKFMPSYPAAVAGKFNPEIQVFRGYWMIRWFKHEFASRERIEAKKLGIAPEILLNKELNNIPPGSDGLILQPYWKPDLKHPEAKGSIIGFSDVHTRAHIYRAIIEGINYNLYDGLLRIQKVTKTKIDKIYVSGGGSVSDSICQITADMFGIQVVRGETYEASGLGAAINGYIGIGIYESYVEAVKHMVRDTDVFKPNMEHHDKYHKIYSKVYKKIYPKLKKLYKELNDII